MPMQFIFLNDQIHYKNELIKNVQKYWPESCEWLTNLCDKCYTNRLPAIKIALINNQMIGYYVLMHKEYLKKQVSYTPWISVILIFEPYRKNRYSPLIIEDACSTLKSFGFNKAYLATSHIQYYEKYNCKEIDIGILEWDEAVKIYVREFT